MPRHKAVFLDRDGTLSWSSPGARAVRDKAIGVLIGREGFSQTHEERMGYFWRVWEIPGMTPMNTLERERCFWIRVNRLLLEDNGVIGNAEKLAEDLETAYPYHSMMELYPETVEVLSALKGRGYRMGVISDTSPSLELSVRNLGIGDYFESFTASSLVGAGKPDPRIFNAALESLGVTAAESVFVDDTREEAEGARRMGFMSFFLDRTLKQPDLTRWTVGNLRQFLDCLDQVDAG